MCFLIPLYLWADYTSEWLLTTVEEPRMLSGAKINLFTALSPACLPTVSKDLAQDSGVKTFPVELG